MTPEREAEIIRILESDRRALNETRAKLNEVQEAVYLTYAELWGHYRALIVALGSLGVSQAERIEAEAYSQNLDRLIDEGRDRLGQMTGKLSPPNIGPV